MCDQFSSICKEAVRGEIIAIVVSGGNAWIEQCTSQQLDPACCFGAGSEKLGGGEFALRLFQESGRIEY